MLSSLIRIPTSETPESPEDIFTSALGLIFTDDTQNMHGDPAAGVIYKSKEFGDVHLTLANPVGEDERKLFAHYLWNASLLLGELMGRASHCNVAKDATGASHGNAQKQGAFNAEGQTVLELGAGTGLAGIISILAGSKETVITDYPAPEILGNVKSNVKRSIPHDTKGPTRAVSVEGHQWGDFANEFALSRLKSFTRVIAADCLWMPWEHASLISSLDHFLSEDPKARVWIVAGFHTGRSKVAAFFDEIESSRLEVETIWEVDVDMKTRPWALSRDENVTERKRWLVLAILKRRPS